LIGVARPLPSPPQELYLEKIGEDWVLAWGDPTFFLQETTNLNLSTWTTLLGRRSPYLITPTVDGQKFYRLYKP
jgi:hypothetical protein